MLNFSFEFISAIMKSLIKNMNYRYLTPFPYSMFLHFRWEREKALRRSDAYQEDENGDKGKIVTYLYFEYLQFLTDIHICPSFVFWKKFDMTVWSNLDEIN